MSQGPWTWLLYQVYVFCNGSKAFWATHYTQPVRTMLFHVFMLSTQLQTPPLLIWVHVKHNFGKVTLNQLCQCSWFRTFESNDFVGSVKNKWPISFHTQGTLCLSSRRRRVASCKWGALNSAIGAVDYYQTDRPIHNRLWHKNCLTRSSMFAGMGWYEEWHICIFGQCQTWFPRC